MDVHLVSTRTYANHGNHTCVANNWITVTSNVGIDDVETMIVNIYPNPTSRILNVQSASGIGEVVVYNALGQQVLRQQAAGERMQLDLGHLAAGSYTMTVTALDGEQATRRINIAK